VTAEPCDEHRFAAFKARRFKIRYKLSFVLLSTIVMGSSPFYFGLGFFLTAHRKQILRDHDNQRQLSRFSGSC
jgi:hypothetical protein